MRSILLSVFFFSGISLFAQEGADTKFGKITPADLERRSYAADSSAEAVIIADIGSTQIKGSRKGWFSLEFKRFKRIHVLNKNGYRHASVEILLYTNGNAEEQLTDLRATTYNLVNGVVETTKLDVSASVFRDKLDKHLVIKKFTLPQVKEGSVIEYEYKISSDFLFRLQPWAFQGEIPTLWSEYKVGIPQFLNYRLIAQGAQNFYTKEQKDKTGTYSIDIKKETSYGSSGETEMVNITCGLTEFRWGMKDMPALRTEAYATTPDNYISKLEFQLSGYQDPLIEKSVMTTWPALMSELIKDEDFGAQLDKSSSWLSGEMATITGSATTETDKAKNIYVFIRDNFTCTDHYQVFLENSLKNIFEKKRGGVAEINLLLTALLRSAGLQAQPILLSTRQNGIIYPRYPIISRFNYVICRTMADGKWVLLDASQPKLGFGKLDHRCYNGQAKVVDEAATDIYLKTDELLEKAVTNISLSMDQNGGWTGKVNTLQGYYASVDDRNRIKANGMENFQKMLAGAHEGEITVRNMVIDSLSLYENPLRFKYDIAYTAEQGDMLYVNPVLQKKYKQNPFKSADRLYPVELPYKINDQYTCFMTIPAGYKVEELPKSVIIRTEGSDAVFEYAVSATATAIKTTYKLVLDKTNYSSSEYGDLREFFNHVVAKQSEQIVLKKIN